MRMMLWVFLIPLTAWSQRDSISIPISKYGLPVISDPLVYRKLLNTDPDNMLMDMKKLLPDEHYDVTYATKNNILKRKIYPKQDLFMRKPAAAALVKVAAELKVQGFGLLLYDGYRPYDVTVLFYEEIGDTTFVADPRKGSKHNRGMAIDLSMYNLKTGKAVLMPSDYDEATPRAFHAYMDAPAEAIRHRAILRTAMELAGFQIYPWEWWHFDFKGWEKCNTYNLWHDLIRQENRIFLKNSGDKY
jgi:D-alanyl-D-alanine dipeptidase